MAERFWEKVLKTDGCWLWQGYLTPLGYGKFQFATSKPKLAHRISWELTNGPIPEGKSVLHDCPEGDNPTCVNPSHLWLGDHYDNMADMVSKERSARGTAKPHAKLTDDIVKDIRNRHASGISTIGELANEFGTHYVTIFYALKGKTWKHVQ